MVAIPQKECHNQLPSSRYNSALFRDSIREANQLFLRDFPFPHATSRETQHQAKG